ncbi:MAG: DUF5678 domain-containing protein [Methanosarcinales archaeon]
MAEVEEDIRFEKDSDWISIHYKELQEKYPNKYLAIINEKVVGIGEDGEVLYNEITKKYGKEPVIDFIKDTKTIQIGRLKARVLL